MYRINSNLYTPDSVSLADDYKDEFPLAAEIVHSTFYVDDCLTGGSSLSEALNIREELNSLLSKFGMTLRKWQSNNKKLLSSIPESLCKSSDLCISTEISSCAKILVISWDIVADVFRVIVPDLDDTSDLTNRQVASAVACC